MLKRLLNDSEEITNERLKSLAEEWGSHTFPKVRLADVFPISGSGISDTAYRFALQSHFDFLITDKDLYPLFAVEFDGKTHLSEEQRQRDAQKDSLCKHFELPLLRITSRYLEPRYRGLDLLGWFIHSWFVIQGLAQAQLDGSLPPDEPIDPAMVYSLPGNPNTFPLWLSGEVRAKIQMRARSHPEQDPCPSCITVKDAGGVFRTLVWLRLDRQFGILARTKLKNQLFPGPVSELVEDIAILNLWEALSGVPAGTEKPIPLDDLDREIKKFAASGTMYSSSGFARKL